MFEERGLVRLTDKEYGSLFGGAVVAGTRFGVGGGSMLAHAGLVFVGFDARSLYVGSSELWTPPVLQIQQSRRIAWELH